LVIPKVPWPLPEIVGDRDLLSLAFFNLIENAMKFTGKENTVEVRAMEHDRQVRVEIADTGPGIPAEDLPRVFEELYRGTNARGHESSGLGLALVRRVIDRHQGTIAVRSRRDGARGTVFTVSLPLIQSAPGG
jgi:Osmosensitive K+ channel histidine kinase